MAYFITKTFPTLKPILEVHCFLSLHFHPVDKLRCWAIMKNESGDFTGGTVVKNLPANAGDTGSSPGPGRSHMPRSNQAREPQLPSLHAATTEALTPRARAPQQGEPTQ